MVEISSAHPPSMYGFVSKLGEPQNWGGGVPGVSFYNHPPTLKNRVGRSGVELDWEETGFGDPSFGQALIKLIQQTKSPVICICNDRSDASVRQLASHCSVPQGVSERDAALESSDLFFSYFCFRCACLLVFLYLLSCISVRVLHCIEKGWGAIF